MRRKMIDNKLVEKREHYNRAVTCPALYRWWKHVQVF